MIRNAKQQMKVENIAACPSCHGNMGIVSDETYRDEIAINNIAMTAYVSPIPCERCGTTVFRADRKILFRIQR